MCYLGTPEDQEAEMWSSNEQWNKYPSQKSKEVYLEKGKPYYFEVFHKQGGGGQHVEIGWATPVSEHIQVIPSANLALYKQGKCVCVCVCV